MHSLPMLLLLVTICVADNNCSQNNTENAVEMRAVRGLNAWLPCGKSQVFLDGPESYMLWMKNERVVYRFPRKNPEKTTYDYPTGAFCESSFCRDNTSLIIRKANKYDEGLYRCRIHYQASPSVDYVIKIKLVEPTGLPRIFDTNGLWLKFGIVGPLSLGSDITLICEVISNLRTKVYWRRNGVLVDPLNTSRRGSLRTDVHLRNISRGELNVKYECLAQNSDVSDPLSSSVIVKITMPPLSVEIRMDDNYDFEAGQPRVVDCVVVGCEPPPAIAWTLGSNIVRASIHKELHDGNYTVSSLRLAPSLSDHHNELVCHVYNQHLPDLMFQDRVTLNVGYRPTCQIGYVENIGAVVGEFQSARCLVDAYPEPLQFSWIFVDSKTMYSSFIKVSGYYNRYESNLTWMTRDDDFGIFICQATNVFGESKNPCTYRITPGGPPELPECNVHKIYPNSLRVHCEKGWDGGRPQMVHLDIVDENGVRIINITDQTGNFFVPNMHKEIAGLVGKENENMTAVLYATNSRGKSDEVTIYLKNLIPISEGSNYIDWMPYIEVLAGVVSFGFAVLAFAVLYKILMARCKHFDNVDIVPRSDGMFHREPDIVRDERVLGTTNITVNQLAPCQNQYSPSPSPACRVLVGHGLLSPYDSCSSSQHTYYV